MSDRPTGPTPEQLEELGLDAADLDGFDDGVREGTEADLSDEEVLPEAIGTPPATDDAPAPAPADQQQPPAGPGDRKAESQTPHAQAEAARKAQQPPASTPSSTEPATPAPGSHAAPAPAAAAAPAEEKPWTFAADGRRDLTIAGATVDAEGNIRIPATAVPQLQNHLADRTVWRAKEQSYQQQIRQLDPNHNEQVQLSRLIAEQMTAAADPEKGGSDEKLWEWVQGFLEKLPALKAEVRSKRLEHDNQLLREQIEPAEREQLRQEIEPQIQAGIQQQLERYFAAPEYAGLAGQRDKLAARLWALRSEGLVQVADRDYPEIGLARGQLYLRTDMIERELGFARDLVGEQEQRQQQERERAAAAARNRAALEPAPVPPVPSATGATIPADPSSAPRTRFRDREEYQEHMRKLAETPGR